NPNYSAYLKAMIQIVYTALGKSKKLRPLPIIVSLDLDRLRLQGYYCHTNSHRFTMFDIGHIALNLDDALVELQTEAYFSRRELFSAVMLNHPNFDEILIDKIITIFRKSYINEAKYKADLYVYGLPV